MTLQETIKLSKEAKKISIETGRDYKEVYAEMKANTTKKTVKLNTSKGSLMTEKEIAKSNFNRIYQPKEIKDMHAYNRANAMRDLPSSMR